MSLKPDPPPEEEPPDELPWIPFPWFPWYPWPPGTEPPLDLRLQYHNANPNPARICPVCQADIGKVFRLEDAPRLPRHPHCYCFYVVTDAPVTKGGNTPMTEAAEPACTGRRSAASAPCRPATGSR